MLCHGRGNSTDGFNGGCCWVNGAICANRWFLQYPNDDPTGPVQDATILDSTGASLGTVFDYVDDLMPGGGPNKAARMQRAFDQAQGAIYLCAIPVYLLGNDPSLINDRPTLEAQWAADPDYQPVADHWESIGKPRNWCPLYGPAEQQCCYEETPAENDTERALLTVDAVTVRSQATGAS